MEAKVEKEGAGGGGTRGGSDCFFVQPAPCPGGCGVNVEAGSVVGMGRGGKRTERGKVLILFHATGDDDGVAGEGTGGTRREGGNGKVVECQKVLKERENVNDEK